VMSLWGEDACAGKSPTMHVYLEHLLGRQSRTTSYARDTRVITHIDLAPQHRYD
jgi:hypothetical protein